MIIFDDLYERLYDTLHEAVKESILDGSDFDMDSLTEFVKSELPVYLTIGDEWLIYYDYFTRYPSNYDDAVSPMTVDQDGYCEAFCALATNLSVLLYNDFDLASAVNDF